MVRSGHLNIVIPTYHPPEPGYYADGRFGIRIENIVLVRDVKTPNNFGGRGYLGFEHVTMVCLSIITDIVLLTTKPNKCPIHKKLVDTDLLTVDERRWLDVYHAEILEKLSPLLQNDHRALEWLKRECSPL